MIFKLVSEVHAAAVPPAPTIKTGVINGQNTGVATIKGFNDLFKNTLTVVIEIAAVVLFLMLISGGFKYITSGGNPKTTEAARNTITYAILGMVLVAAAYLFLQLIQQFTGAPVTNFDVIGH